MDQDAAEPVARASDVAHAVEIEAILQGFAAAGADRGLYYLSTAITTGRRELELVERLGCRSRSDLRTRYPEERMEAVVQANERDALLKADVFAETVALGLLVVNPARITFGHWQQNELTTMYVRGDAQPGAPHEIQVRTHH